MKPSPAPLREILAAFQETYCGPIGVEFLHIQDKHIRRWLIQKMESTRNKPALSAEQKRIILQDLLRTEALEHMLHQSFVGQKRFSLEGSESIVPCLHFLVDSAGRYGIEDFVIGTTHRGRLSILNTILHMTPEEIFSRFEESFQPGMYGGGGDVKYHIGYETDHILDDGGTVHISMASNASHLESVDPVVEGKARALQDNKGDRQRKRVVPVLLHGDAAFSGQGVVAETLNLANLEGYTTGGTIHIIINNQIGFTTPVASGAFLVLPDGRRQDAPGPDLPRQRRRSRGRRLRGRPGASVPPDLRQRLHPGRLLLPPVWTQRGRRTGLHPPADVPDHRQAPRRRDPLWRAMRPGGRRRASRNRRRSRRST